MYEGLEVIYSNSHIVIKKMCSCPYPSPGQHTGRPLVVQDDSNTELVLRVERKGASPVCKKPRSFYHLINYLFGLVTCSQLQGNSFRSYLLTTICLVAITKSLHRTIIQAFHCDYTHIELEDVHPYFGQI